MSRGQTKSKGQLLVCLPRACVGELPCGSQPATPKIGSMTQIVFSQVKQGYKLENMRSAAFPHAHVTVTNLKTKRLVYNN